jgi:hypothetical protein
VHAPPVGNTCDKEVLSEAVLEEGEIGSSREVGQRDELDKIDEESFSDSLEATLDPTIDGSTVGGAKGDFFEVSLSVEGSNCQLDGTQEISVAKAQVQSVQLLDDKHVGDEGQAIPEDPPTDPGEEATEAPHLSRFSLTEQEVALTRVKTFCANVLRTLAPPLLKEVQSVTRLSVDEVQETLRRLTRSSGVRRPVRKPVKKVSAAESVLLKALGITPANLEVDESALQDFRHLFNSPLQEQHLRAIAPYSARWCHQRFSRRGSIREELVCTRSSLVRCGV